MTNPTIPTHDEISLRAHTLWKDHGSHHGNDQELWFEAERQLTAGAAAAVDENHGHAAPVHANPKASSQVVHAPTQPDRKDIQADQRKQVARAAQVPRHTGPVTQPATTGKPIYPLAHSS